MKFRIPLIIVGLFAVVSMVYATAFDVSTTEPFPFLDISARDNNVTDLVFNDDGTKLFILGDQNNSVYEYALSTAYDISTATYDSTLSVNGSDTAPQGIAFSTDGTKMFIAGDTGNDITEFSLSVGFDISSTVSEETTYSVNAQDVTPNSVRFNTDGTKMFVLGDAGNDVGEYTLSIGFDLSSTVTYIDAKVVSTEEGLPEALEFSADGTKMYVAGTSGGDVNEYTLSVAFDVSTASAASTYDFTDFEAQPYGLTFNANGSKMYMLGNEFDNVNEYELSTSYDVTTASFPAFFLGDQEVNLADIAFNNDGTKMFVLGFANDQIYEYTLSTAYDVNTATYVDSRSVGAQDINPRAFEFNDDGTKVFVLGDEGDDINEYTLSVAFDVSSTFTFVDSYYVGALDPDQRGFTFNSDGTEMYVIGNDEEVVIEYELGSAYDISSAIGPLAAVADDPTPRDVEFNGDGTKMYVAGDVDQVIYEYDLSTAYEVSTASLVVGGDLDVSGEEESPAGIVFNNDGSKLFVVGFSGKSVHEYLLSTEYDVSSATHETSYDISGQDDFPQDIAFNADGTQMFITGTDSDEMFEYTLSTGFDLSEGVSLENQFDVGIEESSPEGFHFNSDGTKLFVVGTGGDEVDEYTLSIAYDLSSTVTYIDSLDLVDFEIAPSGLDFNADGTKICLSGYGQDIVYCYDLGVAYDLSSAAAFPAVDTTAQDIFPEGIAFNADGTKMFLASNNDDVIDEFSLSSAFDVATATFTDSFGIDPDTFVAGVQFSSSGSRMYVLGSQRDTVLQYSLGSVPTTTTPGSITQETNGSGYITFSVDVADADSEETSLKVEYSDDGGATWYDPDLVSASPDEGSVDVNDANEYQIGTADAIDTDEGIVTLSIVWDTQSETNENGSLDDSDQDDIRLRVTANDGSADGETGTSDSFSVDNLDPTIASRTTADFDGDGYIDAMRIVFDEVIEDDTVTIGNFAIAGAFDLAFSSTTNGDSADDNDIYITFTDGALDSGSTAALTYTAGDLEDAYGNALQTNGPTASTDGAGPALLTAVAGDGTNVIGGIDDDDIVTLTFSEDTNEPVINAGNIDTALPLNNGHSWLDGGGAIGSAVWNNASTLVITLSDGTSDPDIEVGDTVSLDGTTITDGTNNGSTSSSPTITGTFFTNVAPTATNPTTVTQSTDGSGYVTFESIISDTIQDTSLKVEYSDDDGVSWYDPVLISATPDSGSVDLANGNEYQIGTANAIDTSGADVVLTIVWDTQSVANENGSLDDTNQSDIKLRVTPNDGITDGVVATSLAFEVDNLAPSGLTALTVSSHAKTTGTLAWTATTEANLAHYEIWIDETQGNVTSRSGATEWDDSDDADLLLRTTTTTTITGLTANTQYYAKIWAVDDFGNEETVDDINFYTSAPEVTGVSISNTSTSSALSLSLGWSNSGQTGMKIEQDTDCDDAYDAEALFDNVAANETSPLAIDSLAANTCYKFKLSSYNVDGDLNTDDAVESAEITTPPGAPTNVSASASGSTATITWTAVEGADSYKIYSGLTDIELGSTDTTSYVRSNLGFGLNYPTYVRSVNTNNGTGLASSTVEILSGSGEGYYLIDNDDFVAGGGGGGSFGGSSSKNEDDSEEDKVAEVEKLPENSSQVVVEEKTDFVFTDVTGHWSEEFVIGLYAENIIDGYDENHYEPELNITRAEFTKIVVNVFGYDIEQFAGFNPFVDVEDDIWYQPYISAAYANGLLVGYSDGTFKPNQNITRAEALRILFEAAFAFEEETYVGNLEFEDVESFAWYYPYVAFAKENGIVDGYDAKTFGPNNSMKRAEAAKIVYIMLQANYFN